MKRSVIAALAGLLLVALVVAHVGRRPHASLVLPQPAGGTFLEFSEADSAPAALAPAADLAKVDRSLKKEPAYRAKPQYCLFVFGRDAETRVWLVVDGDLAYLDRNANRDLTDDGEGLEVKPGNEEARRAKLGEIKPAAGKNAYRIVYLDLERIWVEVRDGFVQYAPLSYADRPEDAPIFHFDGPLALMPNPEDIKHGLIRGNQVNQFRVLVGTRTSDKGVVFVECDQGFPDKRFRVPASGFPGGLHPVVDIEFPGRVKGDKSIQRTFPLDQRC